MLIWIGVVIIAALLYVAFNIIPVDYTVSLLFRTLLLTPFTYFGFILSVKIIKKMISQEMKDDMVIFGKYIKNNFFNHFLNLQNDKYFLKKV